MFTTSPIIVIAGGTTFSDLALSTISSKVPTVTLWFSLVPFSITATGVLGFLPFFIKSPVIKSKFLIPIKNTKVPSNLAIVEKSCHSPFSIVCPVNTWNDLASPLCVTGIPAYSGTAIEELIPGIISKGIEYLDSQINFLPDDPKLQEKRDELEKLRLEHLEDYSQKNIDKATARTAPVMEYYKKLNEDTINQFDITSNTNYLVFVNIAEQKTYVYEGSKNDWTLDKTFTCSTGIEGKETPVGVFTVQNRAPWFFSPKYGQGGKYYVQFMGNYLFHSIPFDSDRTTVSDPTLGVPSSHGCIRLSVEDSKWLYDNVQNGSKIIIY